MKREYLKPDFSFSAFKNRSNTNMTHYESEISIENIGGNIDDQSYSKLKF